MTDTDMLYTASFQCCISLLENKNNELEAKLNAEAARSAEYEARAEKMRDLLRESLPVLHRAFFANYKDTNAANELYDKIKAAVGGDLNDVKPNSIDVQPIDDNNEHIVYIGRKAYLAENTIMEFMKKMDIIRDSLAYIENYFDIYAETIRQINACQGRCTDIAEVKYFIDRIKENSRYD